jgi:release factor glutamine methyltransferase
VDSRVLIPRPDTELLVELALELLGLELEVEVLVGMPSGHFDLVLANLPYVSDRELAELEPEITLYEPRQALAGGPDGLDQIRALVQAAPAGTRLALEHAPQQAAAVRGLLEGAETRRDLGARERVTLGRAP